jgi:site-specific DNA recombinase
MMSRSRPGRSHSSIDIVWREVGWKELAGELVPDTLGGEMLEMEAVA